MTRQRRGARCGHGEACWVTPVWIAERGDWDQNIVRLECRHCGEFLPFGKANDEPAEVRQEIRAVEAATIAIESPKSTALIDFLDNAEIAGWCDGKYDSAKVPDQDGEWSGWLAQIIYAEGGQR